MTAPPWELPEIIGTPLTTDRSSAVCIVGAGLVGVTVAYLLARDGTEVTVLDAGAGGTGETWRTTAHLVTALDRGWTALRAVHGDEHARVAAASHAAAIARMERLVAEEAIACDFRRVDGFLFGSPGAGPKALLDELAAAQAAGVDGVEIVARTPLAGMDVGPALRFPAQGRLHPSRYLRGLAAAAVRAGAVIAPHTAVVDVESHGPFAVRTANGATVTAGAVVVATNTPINTTVAIHVKQAAYRSYVIAAPVRRGAVADALYWDTEEPFHYVRLADAAGDHQLLLVGGEDHKTGQDGDGPDARFARLEQWARERFPLAGPVAARWSGQVMESMDGLAFIGPLDAGRRLYVVSGDSGNGFTHATIAGLLLADLVAGRENPWAATYDPSRLRLRALGTLANENLNVARQLADWVDGAETHDPATVAPGTGRIVRRGVRLAAVYRDPDGSVHELSAVCPHLGCIVRWNAGERSWDCPCHGSRFDPMGRVVHGPAHRDLDPVAPPDARRRAG